MVITIDGPAASGKSTVARKLACKLGFDYLDTGAMYRAVTWKALQEGADLQDPEEVAEVAAAARLDLRGDGGRRRILCDGEDVTEQIRTPQVTENIYHVADEPQARKVLIEQQREVASRRDVVTEGRDQGTDVFPDADFKFYLDASLEERARRRLEDLREAGEDVTFEQVRRQMEERDKKDKSRPMGALRQTDSMITVDSTDLAADEVVEKMASIVQGGEEPGG